MISQQSQVDPGAKLGKNVKIHPFVVIDDNVEIGDNCEIMPFTHIVNGTRMGSNNRIFEGCIIGADPQDFRWTGEDTHCYIGDNNVIRENVIINRGIRRQGGTRIDNGVFIMAQSHIGHDSWIKDEVVLGNGISIAGDTEVGKNSILSSRVVLHENTRVGDWVLVKGGCRIGSNVPPYSIFAHNPVEFLGVNAVVMRRKGFSDDDIQSAAKSYRHLYQTQTSVFNAVKRINEDVDEGEIRFNILEFIDRCGNRLVSIPAELNG